MQAGPDPLSLITGTQASSAHVAALAASSSSSLAARRSAASGLPSTFELPPPPSLTALQNKYHGPSNGSSFNANVGTSGQGAGNLLTPPNTVPGEGLSPPPSGGSSGVTSASASIAVCQPQAAPSYHHALWSQSPPPIANQPFGYHTGPTQQWIPPRGLYSPLNSLVRAHPDNAAYEMNQLPPFMANGMSIPSPSSLPNMASAQAQAQVQAQHQAMMMSAQQQHLSNSAVLNQNPPMQHNDSYGIRPPPTPTYFPQSSAHGQQGQSTPNSSTPQHSGMPFVNGVHHSQVSPLSGEAQSVRMSPIHAGGDGHMSTSSLPGSLSSGHSHSQSPPNQYSPHQRAYSHHYSLPAMPVGNGPVMSNMHSPNSQMALVGGHGNMGAGMMPGGFTSGHAAASMQNMYGNPMSPHQHQSRSPPHHGHNGSHSSSGQTPNDRPFKCDQCVQSFNRNHDLKRHKRIHLAVKPYPCGHCDKSFSRKDALKRHILVKGCGKMSSNSSGGALERSSSGGSDGSISPMSYGVQSGVVFTDNSPQRINGVMKLEA